MELFSIDDFYSKKTEAEDWTGKVIAGKKIDSLTFNVPDFAQKNLLKYAADDTVIVDAGGCLESRNESLEKEKVLYEMKFAASDDFIRKNYDGDVSVVYIPLYTYDLSPEYYYDPPKKNSIKPRIVLVEYDDAGYPTASFNKLYFSEFIQYYYESYQKLILHPKVIEVQVLLTDLEIRRLDLMTPVYLEQTGNHYIILELQVNANNTAKAKLIQM